MWTGPWTARGAHIRALEHLPPAPARQQQAGWRCGAPRCEAQRGTAWPSAPVSTSMQPAGMKALTQVMARASAFTLLTVRHCGQAGRRARFGARAGERRSRARGCAPRRGPSWWEGSTWAPPLHSTRAGCRRTAGVCPAIAVPAASRGLPLLHAQPRGLPWSRASLR